MSATPIVTSPLSADDRARVQRMAQMIRAAILGADRAAEDEADRIARHVVDRMRTATLSPATIAPSAAFAATDLDERPPILLTTAMAARLLGCSLKALYHRVAERQIPSSCVVRSGRRILLHRERLLAAIDRKAGR